MEPEGYQYINIVIPLICRHGQKATGYIDGADLTEVSPIHSGLLLKLQCRSSEVKLDFEAWKSWWKMWMRELKETIVHFLE